MDKLVFPRPVPAAPANVATVNTVPGLRVARVAAAPGARFAVTFREPFPNMGEPTFLADAADMAEAIRQAAEAHREDFGFLPGIADVVLVEVEPR